MTDEELTRRASAKGRALEVLAHVKALDELERRLVDLVKKYYHEHEFTANLCNMNLAVRLSRIPGFLHAVPEKELMPDEWKRWV